MDSGVYAILCRANAKMYIGSTNDLTRREKEHFVKLRKGEHNVNLQADFNKYGEEMFKFIILLPIEDNLLEAEKSELEKYKNRIYNTITDPTNHKGENNPCYGRKLTEEQKKALHDGWRGNPSPNRKLTFEQCLEIMQLLKEETNETLKEKYVRISNIYGGSPRTIQKIKEGNHWSNKQLEGKDI